MNVNKMISLIDRIGLKLPCKNGKKLKTLEADVLIQHIVNAITDLSRFKFGTIDQTFRKYLEAYSNIPSNDISMMTNLWKFYQGTSVESPSKETSNH
ncbi:unnamed protein product [Rhizophagus irregularis]|uniref:Uncharacterized protein n=1 Tax=Rhizophagus irregularis TaxID=588596 RepID=A0A2I1G732_9GLOM|nr:hypothetical protein RhiirA4_456261 [Rhizophagus irregularis]CAB4410117.1 unnamed protein product [Rhizophagus irregularis]CAB4410584.1 unnamed protein product [Rhizophagus irregularis]